MGDSEPMVAQTSTVVEYNSSGGYASTGYAEAAATAPSTIDGSTQGDAIPYNSESTAMQEVPPEPTQLGVADGTESVGAPEKVPLNSSQAAGYDSTANGSVSGEMSAYPATENGDVSDVGGQAAAVEQRFDDASAVAMSAEEERLWSIVRANSLDFNAWTALIDVTEKTDNIMSIRRVYDGFLAEFPLCYGYWKKYADHEHRFGSIDKVVEVYERAVLGVTYSVEIWLHYSTFSISTYGDPETIRRSSPHVWCKDYLSCHLWDKYIEYEYLRQEWSRLAMIYTRILEHPNQQLDRYFNSFKELAGFRPLSELRTAEEDAAPFSFFPESDGQEIDGKVPADAMGQSTKPVSGGFTEAKELEKYIAIREEMYKKTKEFDSKIIGFETAIRRPYFHVRPLNVSELENWDNYLDFIEREGDFNKVLKLYERCLIACANYSEYWIRYVLCMKASGSMDLAEIALARATQVFVKRQPDFHLFAARFKEQHGDVEGARAAYQLVHSEISPGLLGAIVKHANMEHRQGKLDDAFMLYDQAIAIEKENENSQALPKLYAQYSRFVFLSSGNADKAWEILDEAVQHVQFSKPLLEGLIHLESFLPPPRRIDHIDTLIDKFLASGHESANSASASEREEISSIFLEFLDIFGDATSIAKADERHSRLFLHHRSTSVLRKRYAEDYLAVDKAKVGKSYPGVTSAVQLLMGAYPSAQNQWAAGYGAQAQAWPQVTPAQWQPWNAGYTQQAAATAGAAAAAVAPAPQPASAPQDYYGSSYYCIPSLFSTEDGGIPSIRRMPATVHCTSTGPFNEQDDMLKVSVGDIFIEAPKCPTSGVPSWRSSTESVPSSKEHSHTSFISSLSEEFGWISV